jgi:hypothetical protein
MAQYSTYRGYNRELLGFDFFIADDVLDRPVNDFIGLLRRYKAAA